jgi:beta-glucosidase
MLRVSNCHRDDQLSASVYGVLLLTVLSLVLIVTPLCAQPYLDPRLPVERRAADLVSCMSLEEKIGQMQNEAFGIPRLGIHYYNWSAEVLHGIVNEGGFATVFPQAIGMAATWDVDLIRVEADVISTEARAWYYRCLQQGDTMGVHKGLTCWSPNINIFRDPRWGRGQETYGEDPYLTSRIGVAFVRGLQGDDPKYFKVIATPKHYAVHSGPEPQRHRFNAVTSKRDLFETYLPAFEACVREGGAFSVMGAYSEYLDVPCCASTFLLKDILRDRWGFRGYVVSDCGAIGDIVQGHNYKKDAAEASATAVKAGCDITCGDEYAALTEAVRRNLITASEIDTAVTRLMTARLRLGLFDPPEMVPFAKIDPSAIDAPAHRELALEVARKSIVLLRNEGGLLPLDPARIKRLAVIGPYTMRDDILYGNYSGVSEHPVTFLQGIKNRLDGKVRVECTKGVLPIDEAGALSTVPTRCVQPPDGRGQGLLGEYFDNPELHGKPVLTQVDSSMVQYWDKNAPGKGLPADNFSVRWTGTLTPPESGTYILGIVTDDRGRMYFEGSQVVDNWRPCQKNVMKTFRTFMERGRRYAITIEYADSADYAGIRFQWKRDVYDAEDTPPELLMARAIEITKNADVAIVFAGISANLEGEEMSVSVPGFSGGDRTTLGLPDAQSRMLKALKATGTPIVLVLSSGSPLAIPWENENIPAILQSWYPGEEGGNAVADVLFGRYNPAGRLPVTVYRSVDDIPPFEQYSMNGRTYRYFGGTPLYPFGFGLSYTSFSYSSMSMSAHSMGMHDSIDVSVDIMNIGKHDGEEVAQLYVRNLASEVPQPIKSLKGFLRVSVPKGGVRKVHFTLKGADFKYYDEQKGDYVIASGSYEIQIGASSQDIRCRGLIEIHPGVHE